MQRRILITAIPAACVAVALVGWFAVTSFAGDDDANAEKSLVSASVTAEEAMADNQADHDEDADHKWDSGEAVPVSLTGDDATSSSDNVSVSDGVVTVTAAGTYQFSGELTDGQIAVDTSDDGIVRLVLDGVTIANSTTAAVVVSKADEVVIVLAEGSTNTLTDASEYVYPDADTDEPNAALFSKSDLTITGTGSLNVEGRAYDGIASKDGLVIDSGTIEVAAEEDGIRGKDYVVINGGTTTVTAGGDGVKSTNDSDASRGYVLVSAGTTEITSGRDGIVATTDVITTGGTIAVTAGGGSSTSETDNTSAKGLSGTVCVVTGGGDLTIDSADTAVYSENAVSLGGGTLNLSSAGTGVKSKLSLYLSAGTLDIIESSEGMEATTIEIVGGDNTITASDDGVNGTDGADDQKAVATGVFVAISGGTTVINAEGDGLDSNGTLEITGGTTVVNGPTKDSNGALDANGTFTISGGTLLATGPAGESADPETGSGQSWVCATLAATQVAGTVIHLATPTGEEIIAFESVKQFESMFFSSDKITADQSYDLYTGGSVSGASVGGLYTEGALGGATKDSTVTAGQG